MRIVKSPTAKAKREAELEKMRLRWRKLRRKTKALKPSKPKPERRSWGKTKRPKKPRAYRPRTPVAKELTFLLSELRVGQSFWTGISSASEVHRIGHKLKRKIMTRTSFRKGEPGIRVTRLK